MSWPSLGPDPTLLEYLRITATVLHLQSSLNIWFILKCCCYIWTHLKELGIGLDRAQWEEGIDNDQHELNPRSDKYNQDNENPLDPVIDSFPTGLEALDMSLHRIKDRHVSLIVKRCPKLQALDINSTYFTERSIETIKNNLSETLVRLSLCSNWVHILFVKLTLGEKFLLNYVEKSVKMYHMTSSKFVLDIAF